MGLFHKGQKPNLKRVKFNLSEDCHINLRELSAQELINLQDSAKSDNPNMDHVFKLIAVSACDDDGKPIFDDAEDAKQNFSIGSSMLSDISKAIVSVSGLDEKKA
jgi:hypothetical protein